MSPVDAVRRFAAWLDRTSLRRAVTDGCRVDRWPEAATAACIIVGALDSAQDDNDLRAGLAKFEAARCYNGTTFERAIENVIKQYSDAAGRPARVRLCIHPRRDFAPVVAAAMPWPPAGCEKRTVRLTSQLVTRLLSRDDIESVFSVANKYRIAMASGDWRVESQQPHDEIRFIRVRSAANSRSILSLCNGNHRLLAIAMHPGLTIKMDVIGPTEVFACIEEMRAELAAAP